ncbi:MAG: PspA/IM30 family protein [Myxococcota bacterium]|nr:PspA/IM30 family protein [Myxococcota bacterium]
MGVLDRIKRVMASNVNALLDKVENPAKLADQALADMDRAIRQGKRGLADQLAEAKLREQRAATLRKDADGWHGKAGTALRAGDEALARDCLLRRHELLVQAVAEDETARAARAEHDELVGLLARLQTEREVFASRKGTLVVEARARRATGKGLSGKLGATGKGPTALERYEEIERQVDVVEAEREVDDLLGVGKDAQLEARLRELDAGGAVEDELAALKAGLRR